MAETTKKITVTKNDEPAAVAEKIIDAAAETIILVIPKFSAFAGSLSNFKLIKREAGLLKKKIIIESVDETVVELAKKAGLEAVNPFFGKATRKKFSDIVLTAKTAKGEQKSRPVPLMVNAEPSKRMTEERMTEVIKPAFKKPRRKLKMNIGLFFTKRNLVVTAILIGVGTATYAVAVMLPKAEISITTKKEAWTYQNGVRVDKSIGTADPDTAKIPGQVFTQKSNATVQFPASGTKKIERKSTGRVLIYNALSSKPQTLVANTRLETPDKKIFRLQASVIVPGANIEDGKIVPSSIVAQIIADKAGAEYNIGPLPKLTIPGFLGTPKYQTFYGELKEPTIGGFVGEIKIATDADIKNAKTEATGAIEKAVRTLLASQLPANFKVLDGASSFSVIKQTVNGEADATGKFSVFTEGQASLLAFTEKDLLAMLAGRIKKEKGDQYLVRNLRLSYESVKTDELSSGRLTVTIDYSAELSRIIDQKALLGKIKGQNGDRENFKKIIETVSGAEGAEVLVSLWPFWVRTIPDNLARIQLSVQ